MAMKNLRKTKIVCSMGPTTANDEIVEKLIKAGMNVARFNFSHGTHETHKIAMERVRRVSEKLQTPVALLLDTKGPEIRTGNVENDGLIKFSVGDKVIITVDGATCTQGNEITPTRLSLSWKDLPNRASKGIKILIADGLIELEVDSIENETVYCTAKNSGSIGSKKNVNIIGLHAGLPIMTDQDKADIAFGVSQNVDFIAASFVSFPSEVVEIRNYLNSLGSHALIIAKIENEEGVNNIDGIIAEADGIMVARGDLGVQLPTERIPLAQKYIISRCRLAGKPVITATQMLDSMISNPRPTRAELTDVANAIFDGTDATMLSGETANGKYPVEAVETMATIARTVEDSEEYTTRMFELDQNIASGKKIEHIVAKNAYLMAKDLKAIAIVTPTLQGNTARMVSQFRPEQSIIAVTPIPRVQRQLMLNWGVYPMLSEVVDDSEWMVQNAIKKALDSGVIHLSDRIVMLAGIPINNPIKVNTVKVLFVGNVVAAGNGGVSNQENKRVSGRVFKITEPNEFRSYIRGSKAGGVILVCNKITEDFIPILRIVDGVISEEDSEIPAELLSMVNPNLVWLLNCKGAMKSLETDLTVTIDGGQGLAYEGLC